MKRGGGGGEASSTSPPVRAKKKPLLGRKIGGIDAEGGREGCDSCVSCLGVERIKNSRGFTEETILQGVSRRRARAGSERAGHTRIREKNETACNVLRASYIDHRRCWERQKGSCVRGRRRGQGKKQKLDKRGGGGRKEVLTVGYCARRLRRFAGWGDTGRRCRIYKGTGKHT